MGGGKAKVFIVTHSRPEEGSEMEDESEPILMPPAFLAGLRQMASLCARRIL